MLAAQLYQRGVAASVIEKCIRAGGAPPDASRRCPAVARDSVAGLFAGDRGSARDARPQPRCWRNGWKSLIQARETQWPQALVVRKGDRCGFVSAGSVDGIEAANNEPISGLFAGGQ